MSDLVERTKDFEMKVARFNATRTSPEEADRLTGLEMETVRQQHQRNGFQMANADTLDAYERSYRTEYDRGLLNEGTLMEVEKNVLAREVAEAITAREALPSAAAQYGTSTTNMLMATIVDELQMTRVRQELAALTRTQLLERLATWKDDTHGVYLRMVEPAVLAGDVTVLGIRDGDGEEGQAADAIAIPKLRQAVIARRQARVPLELREAHARLEKVFGLGFSMTMRFLRDGMGIAARPGMVR